MSEFYIYRWIRLDTNQPFYVGKGKGNRFKIKNNRNEYFKRILNKVECKTEIFIKNLTEDIAFTKEMEFIKLYKIHSLCEANLTNGGEGCSGMVHNEKSKNKSRISNKTTYTNNPNIAKKISNHLKDLHANNPELRKTLNEKRNKAVSRPFNVYKSIKNGHTITKGDYIGTWNNKVICIDDLKIKKDKIGNAKGVCNNLLGKAKSAYGYIFEYATIKGVTIDL